MPPRIRDRWVHIRVRRGSRYSSCASSTCSLASWLRARVEKMSRMTSGRSITRTLSSRSRLAPCTGLSSSSKMTSVAPASATARGHFLDLAFADERRGIGRGDLLGDPADDFGAGGVHQAGELFEVLGHVPGVPRPLARGGNQNGTLDRVADFDRCSADGFSSSPLSGWWRRGCTPARLSGTRPSLVNGTLCGAQRCLDRQSAPSSCTESRRSSARPATRCPRRPTRSGAAATAWYGGPVETEVVGVAHVPHVRPFDVEAECSLVPRRSKGFGFSTSQLEIELPTPHADVAHAARARASPRVLQHVADGRAAGQRGREHQGSRSTSERHPRLLVDGKDTASSRMSGGAGVTWCHPESHGVIPSHTVSSRAERAILRSCVARTPPPPPSAFFRSHHAIRSATFFSYPNPPGR